MKLTTRVLVPGGLLLHVGCIGGTPAERSAPQALHADSSRTAEEHLRRFTADLADRPTELFAGAAAPEQLVSRFVGAVEQKDTLALMQTHLTRSEFAYLYYPTHPQAQPPYSLPPDLMWMMLEAQSTKGVSKAVSQLGHAGSRVEGVRCQRVVRYGENQVHFGCSATLTPADTGSAAVALPLGPLVERDGQFKFVSFGAEG